MTGIMDRIIINTLIIRTNRQIGQSNNQTDRTYRQRKDRAIRQTDRQTDRQSDR